MLLVSWLRDLRRRASQRRRRHRQGSSRNEVSLYLTRLEDRQVLSASGLAALDVGDTLDTAHETGLGPGSGSYVQAETLGNGPQANRDTDLYRFRAAAGATLLAQTSQFDDSVGTDTVLRLFDEFGLQLAVDDDGGAGLFSQIDFTFLAGGTYFVGVSGFGNTFYDPADGSGTFAGAIGDYELTLRLTADAGDVGDTLDDAEQTGLGAESGLFVRSETLGNSVLAGADIDLYRFDAAPGDTLSVLTSRPTGSADLANTFVRLFDANGSELAFDDDTGPGQYSRLRFTFDESGTYFVGVSAFPNVYYDPADPTGAMTDDPDAVDDDPLFAGAPGEYRLTLSLDTGDVLADARETGIGTATDSFTRTERLGDGRFGLQDVDVFRLVAGEGDALDAATFLRAGSIAPVDTTLRLFDAAGAELAFNDDRNAAGGDLYSSLQFTFAAAGTYYVAVSAFPNVGYSPVDGTGTVEGDSGGEYELRLSLTQAIALAEIRGTKFNDANGNGVREPGEDGAAGVTIFLDENGNGVLDLVEPVTVTDAEGNYAFTGLVPGAYRVGEVLPADFVQTFPAAAPIELLRADFSDASGDPSADGFVAAGAPGFANEWHLSTGRGSDAGHSADDSFYFGSGEGAPGGGSYSDFALGVLTSPAIDLTGVIDARVLLEFNHFLEIEDFDALADFLAVSVTTGAGFEIVATRDDFGTFDFLSGARSTAGFESVSLDISQFAGQEIQVEFVFASDGSVTFEGWYVDDVVVRVEPSGLHAVTLAPGEVRTGVDFGNRFFDPAEIRGTKFLDLNGDGLRNAGESGLAGATIFIDRNGNGLFEADGSEPFATTADDGSYALTNLEPGTYTLAEIVGPGFAQTFPASPGTQSVTVAAGDMVTGIDFGNRIVPTGSIRGTVYNDLNDDGVRGAGEPGVGGVSVVLEREFASTDVPTPIDDLTTVTSDLLVPGLAGRITDLDVSLDITHTSDSDLEVYLISPSGTRILLFSNVGGAGGNFTGTTLDDEAQIPIGLASAPFTGSFRPEELLSAFDGQDPNGIWQLEITDFFRDDTGRLTSWSLDFTTDSPLDGPRQTVTGATGEYVFAGLFPGTYRILEFPPPGAIPSFPAPTPLPGFEIFRADFTGPQGLPDAEGFTSSGLPGFIDQWHVTTSRGTDPGHSPDASFYFGDELFGPSYANDGRGFLVSPFIDVPDIQPGQQIRLEFNHFLQIEDSFDFLNVNVLSAAGSTEVAGDEDFGTVDLFTGIRSTNGFEAVSLDISQFAGERIQIEFEFTSDSIVTYEGWYVDDVAVSISDAGPPSRTVTLQPGEVAGGLDFGNLGNAAITGTVFNDLNGNRVPDPGESARPGATVFLDQNGNGGLDGAGTFRSMDVPRAIPDLSSVTSVLSVGNLTGTIADVNVTLDVAHPLVDDLDLFLISPAGTIVSLASGFNGDIFGPDLPGTTFDDEAAESIAAVLPPYTGSFRPAGSLALFDGQNPNGNWRLVISDTAEFDAGVLRAWSLQIITTDAEPHTVAGPDGTYAFAGLLPGTYSVVQVARPGFVQTVPAGGRHDVTLADGEIRQGVNFGTQGARLAGVKFVDANGNGTRDAGEPGLADVTIQAVDSQGRVVAETSTDDDDPHTHSVDETGTWVLDVPAGNLLVREIVPDGFVQTAPGAPPAAVQQFRFDSGADGFTATGQWHRSTGRAGDAGHSPQTSFYFGAGEGPGGGGRYAHNQSGTLVSPVIQLPAADRLFLEFNHLLGIEDFFDQASVAIVSGGVRTVIADNNAVGGLQDFTDGFQRASFDLAEFAGQAVQIEFSFTSDVSIAFEGWYIDDVSIVAGAPTGAYLVTPANGQTIGGLDFGNRNADRFPDDLAALAVPNLTLFANQVVPVVSFLDQPGDRDVFRFVAPQTGFVAVRMTEPDASFSIDPFLRLFDANGNLLAGDDDGAGSLDSLLTFAVTAGETFFVEASHSPSGFSDLGTGVYLLEFVSTGPAQSVAFRSAGASEFVATASGLLVSPGQAQVFRIDAPAGLAAGSTITFDLAAAPGSQLDTVLTVFDAATGEFLATNDDFFGGPFNFNSRVVRPVAAGDSFFVVSGGFVDSTGAFTLTARVAAAVADDFPNTFDRAAPLGTVPAGGAILRNGTIEITNDTDAFVLDVGAGGGLLTVNLVASGNATLDPVLELRDAATGQLIAFNDDAVGLNSRIQRQTAGGERLVVLARGFGTTRGTYTLNVRLDAALDDVPGTLDLGLLSPPFTQPGRIEAPGDVDRFRIEIPAGFGADTLQIRQSAAPLSGLDPLLRVFDAAGNQIAFNDDIGFAPGGAGFSLDSQTAINVRPGDVFFVSAGAFGASTGGYMLGFSTADDFPDTPATARDLENVPATGTLTQSGEIEFAGDRDLFSFTTMADGRVTVRLGDPNPGAASPGDLEGGLVTVLQEFDDGKFRVVAFDASENGESLVVLDAQAGDSYVIQATGFGTESDGTGPEIGAYRLTIATAPPVDDLGDTFADARLLAVTIDPLQPEVGVASVASTLAANDVDVVRFVAPATGVATIGLQRAAGSLVDAAVSGFVFVGDAPDGSRRIPQRIASDSGPELGPDDGVRSIRFNVTAGAEYAVQIAGDGGTAGEYQVGIRTEARDKPGTTTSDDAAPATGQFQASADGMQAVGDAVLQSVRQLRLALPQGTGNINSAAANLIQQAVATFRNANGFDPNTSYLILVLDPVDGVLTESTSGGQIGFAGGQGQVNEVAGGYFSGDGVIEVLILPTVSREFNLSLAGVGSNFLFDARLVTPDGPPGGIQASVALAQTGQAFDGRGGSSDRLLGGLDLVLDFSATTPPGSAGPAPTDVGLAFALSTESAQAAGVGAAPGSLTSAFAADAAQAIAQLRAQQALERSGGELDPLDRLFAEVRQFNDGVARVLRSVGDWIEDSVGVPDAVDSVWSALVPDDGEEWWQKRQILWSSLGNRFAPAPMKLFFKLREAVDRFRPVVPTPGDAPADTAPAPDQAVPAAERATRLLDGPALLRDAVTPPPDERPSRELAAPALPVG